MPEGFRCIPINNLLTETKSPGSVFFARAEKYCKYQIIKGKWEETGTGSI